MNVRSRSRRAAVAFLGAATIGAALPALSGVAGAAGPKLTLTGPSSASAGTCAVYTVALTNDVGEPLTGIPATATLDISVTENPESDTQDVDFCVVPGVTNAPPSAHYTNNTPVLPPSEPAPGTDQSYTPGTSVTGGAGPNAGGNPDQAGGGSQLPNPQDPSTVNPTGTDTLSVTPPSNVYRFGVVGLIPGGADITATYNDQNSTTTNPTQTKHLTLTAGGLPGSNEARDAVSRLVVDPTETFSNLSSVGSPARPAVFTVTAYNGAGDTVSGVPLNFTVDPGGANAPTTAGGSPTATFSCNPTQTSNSGTTECSYQGQKDGVDKVRVFVNQTKNNPTAGWDATEPFAIETVTTFVAPVDRSQARYVNLQPDTATVTIGSSRTFTAVVTSLNGSPAENVVLTFTETGPGTLRGGTVTSGGTSILSATTDSTGSAKVVFDAGDGPAGQGSITVSINDPGTTQCQSTSPSTAQPGNCTDTSPLAVSGTASPSPSASATASPSATPTASVSPTASPAACPAAQQNLPLTINDADRKVNATAIVSVTVTGAPAGKVIELQAYQQTHYGTANFDNAGNIRTAVADSNGAATFNVRFSSNARMRARVQGCTFAAGAGFNVPNNTNVLNVRTVITFSVTRVGTRTIEIKGDSLPARPGGLIVNVNCTDSRCKSASNPNGIILQPRANATSGEFGPVRYRFASSFANQRVVLYGSTGNLATDKGDAQNIAGRSNNRSVLIY